MESCWFFQRINFKVYDIICRTINDSTSSLESNRHNLNESQNIERTSTECNSIPERSIQSNVPQGVRANGNNDRSVPSNGSQHSACVRNVPRNDRERLAGVIQDFPLSIVDVASNNGNCMLAVTREGGRPRGLLFPSYQQMRIEITDWLLDPANGAMNSWGPQERGPQTFPAYIDSIRNGNGYCDGHCLQALSSLYHINYVVVTSAGFATQSLIPNAPTIIFGLLQNVEHYVLLQVFNTS